jgi:hypothetical protein
MGQTDEQAGDRSRDGTMGNAGTRPRPRPRAVWVGDLGNWSLEVGYGAKAHAVATVNRRGGSYRAQVRSEVRVFDTLQEASVWAESTALGDRLK